MKISECLKELREPRVSFEMLPPTRGDDVNQVFKLVEELIQHNPLWLDITSHPASMKYLETVSGIKKVIRRKRPGTLGLCAALKHKFGLEVVPHVLCRGFTKQETEDFLIELNYLGLENVMALQGDRLDFEKLYVSEHNLHASDLIEQIAKLNKGEYLDGAGHQTKFCIGAACYPEKHVESPNAERDLAWTFCKMQKGAEYLVSQMFFNNQRFYDLAKNFPGKVVPGIKVLTNLKQVISLPKTFHCEISEKLVELMEVAQDTREVGINWATKQVIDLRNNGYPLTHFFVMNDTDVVKEVLRRVQ